MPYADGDDGTVFLADHQTNYFAARTRTAMSITDKTGRTWPVEEGVFNASERHFGLFDNGVLVARITLTSPLAQDEHPSPFWCVGRIQVVDRLQQNWIAHRLVEELVVQLAVPLASDIDQTNGGRRIWETLIRRQTGKVELYDPNGLMGPVTANAGDYSPAPWQFRERRLVLNP